MTGCGDGLDGDHAAAAATAAPVDEAGGLLIRQAGTGAVQSGQQGVYYEIESAGVLVKEDIGVEVYTRVGKGAAAHRMFQGDLCQKVEQQQQFKSGFDQQQPQQQQMQRSGGAAVLQGGVGTCAAVASGEAPPAARGTRAEDKHHSAKAYKTSMRSSSSRKHSRPWLASSDRDKYAAAGASVASFTKVCHEADLPGSGLQWAVPSFSSELGYPSGIYEAETGVLHLD